MTSSTPPTANRVMELPVRGMDCAECTQHVQRALASVPGVESVEVFLTSEKAVLRLAPFEVPMDTLRKAVESTGYQVGAVLLLAVAGEWFGLLERVTDVVPWPVGWGLVLLGGAPIFWNVLRAAWRRQVIAHILMCLGVIAALAVGQWTTAAVVVFFMHLGSVRLRATHVGRDTTFGRIIKMVEEAEAHRADVQRLADRFSAYFLPVVAGIALLTFLVSRNPLATAAVLVVACSWSLALATPIAMLASIGAGASRGLLIKGGKYLELLARADVLLIDKTGTDVAMDAAHMALMRDDWGLVPDVFAIAHRTMRVVKMNIVFTALYNLVGLSLAAFGVLPPILAAAAQSLPDLGILANSSRLLRQPRRKTQAASSRDLPVTTRTGEVADAAAS